ncbi:MAG TPA: DUF167 domain-containing protein [Gemmatimonadales bacterium]|nr:DUF167 domain-containing protein [Gemmatimonadales bacterium]
MPPIDPTATGVRLRLHIQPRASATELVGRHGDALKLRVAAPPVHGAANEAVLRWLAERLGVPRSAVSLTAGATARAKTVCVDGVSVTEATRRLAG